MNLDWTDALVLLVLLVATITYFSSAKTNVDLKKPAASAAQKQKTSAPAVAAPIAKSYLFGNNHSASSGKQSLIAKFESLNSDNAVAIFYGSQTGTAEDLATRTQNDIISKLGIPAIVLDVEDYNMEELTQWSSLPKSKKWVCGFFMATYGEGEPTDNAVDFYSWVMNGAGLGAGGDKGDHDDEFTENQILRDVAYVVFGLGNRTYEYFNAVIKRLDKRMTKIGAKRVGTLGQGDDEGSMEEDYQKWALEIVTALSEHFSIGMHTSEGSKTHVSLFTIENVSSLGSVFKGELTSGSARSWKQDGDAFSEESPKHFDSKNPFYSPIINTKPLFTNSADVFKAAGAEISISSDKATVGDDRVTIPRQCYHVEFDLKKSGLTYTTGDHLGVWGNNEASAVCKLAALLGVVDIEQVINLKANPNNALAKNAKLPFPLPCSIKDALTHYTDLHTVIKQHHLEILSHYAENADEKARLLEISQDRTQFVDLIEHGQKKLADILSDFGSLKLPLEVALTEILRPIAVRYYSISSSSLEQPTVVSATAVVVRYALAQKNLLGASSKKLVLKEGFTTSWLERQHEKLTNGSIAYSGTGIPPFHAPVYIRHSTFRLPKDSKTPVVMVGPGTGVAPFRAFVKERFLLATQGQSVGPTILFFGCRNADSDYLYRSEFEEMLRRVSDEKLDIDLQIITAFSRDSAEKVYVQHRVTEHSRLIYDLIQNQNGSFYICGDAKYMAADVNAALEKLASVQGGVDADAGKAWLKDLKTHGRYFEDVWA